MSQFDYEEDCRMGLINRGSRTGQPYMGTEPPPPATPPEWPKCAIHGVEGHMAGSPTCKRTPLTTS